MNIQLFQYCSLKRLFFKLRIILSITFVKKKKSIDNICIGLFLGFYPIDLYVYPYALSMLPCLVYLHALSLNKIGNYLQIYPNFSKNQLLVLLLLLLLFIHLLISLISTFCCFVISTYFGFNFSFSFLSLKLR